MNVAAGRNEFPLLTMKIIGLNYYELSYSIAYENRIFYPIS